MISFRRFFANLFTVVSIFVIIWMFSGFNVTTFLRDIGVNVELLEAIENAIMYFSDDTQYCFNNYEDIDDCRLHFALDAENESYIVPIVMALGQDREDSTTIVQALHDALVEGYYGEG